MKLKENVFSVKNDGFYKIISIFGKKYKIKNKNRIIETLEKEVQNYEVYTKIQHNYKNVVERLRKKVKSEKINIIFMQNEPQKWGYDTLYQTFKNSKAFSPKIIVYPRLRTHNNKDKTMMSLEDQYRFFKDRGYDVEYAYKDNKYIDIKNFNPDIIFLPQISEIEGFDNPEILSEYALLAYVSYAFEMTDYKKNYLPHFHRLLHTYFVEDNLNIERYEGYKKYNSNNCYNSGTPKLDVYLNKKEIKLEKYWKNPEKFKIIYAPHHSIDQGVFNFSTFKQNGKFILDLAKKHPETTWIFKPHPMFKYKIIQSGFMTEKEINDYYREWAEVGKIYDSGDYFDIFKSSDLMITDCSSFLAEYLPSKHPLIRLCREDSLKLNKLGEKITSQYYNSFNNETLNNLFTDIVINKQDAKKEERIELANSMFNHNQTATEKIYSYFLELLI